MDPIFILFAISILFVLVFIVFGKYIGNKRILPIEESLPKVTNPPPMPPCKPPKSETLHRIEVIGPTGRFYYVHFEEGCRYRISYQDGGKTLKVFVEE